MNRLNNDLRFKSFAKLIFFVKNTFIYKKSKSKNNTSHQQWLPILIRSTVTKVWSMKAPLAILTRWFKRYTWRHSLGRMYMHIFTIPKSYKLKIQFHFSCKSCLYCCKHQTPGRSVHEVQEFCRKLFEAIEISNKKAHWITDLF